MNPHPPETQVGEALAGAVQAVAQAPQFIGSVARSRQLLPQRFGVGAEQPVEHAYVLPLELHTGVAAPHT